MTSKKNLLTEKETYITKQFNKNSKSFDEQDRKGLSSTAKKHVETLTEANLSTALDVGAGTGGILNGLLENKVERVYGVDLSTEMLERAKKRLEEKGFIDKAELQHISFLDYRNENTIEGISLHRVLCCHPDREKMLEKAVSFQPKVIVLTIPRTWFFMRGITFLLKTFRKVFKGFQPYLHKIDSIDKQLEQSNYKLVDIFKTKLWITRTYKIN